MTSNDSLAAIASQVQKEVGYVNVVIANSGVSGPSITGISNRKPPASVEELQDYLWKWKPEDFDSTFTINVRGTFFTMVAFLKLLDAGNSHEKSVTVSQGIRSQFIATSSLAGLSRKITMGPAYSASKAATNHLIKMLATYLIPYQIRANVICPGLYPSEMTAVSIVWGQSCKAILLTKHLGTYT